MTDRISRLLQQRAAALAHAAALTSEQAGRDALIVAGIGPDQIGIPLLAARQVVAFDHGAPIPGAPPWLRCIVQVHGELISVLDLETWWNLGRAGSGKHLIVVEGRRGTIGILADTIVDVREIAASAGSSDLSSGRPGVAGVTGDLILGLDLERMLEHTGLIVDHTPSTGEGSTDHG